MARKKKRKNIVQLRDSRCSKSPQRRKRLLTRRFFRLREPAQLIHEGPSFSRLVDDSIEETAMESTVNFATSKDEFVKRLRKTMLSNRSFRFDRFSWVVYDAEKLLARGPSVRFPLSTQEFPSSNLSQDKTSH